MVERWVVVLATFIRNMARLDADLWDTQVGAHEEITIGCAVNLPKLLHDNSPFGNKNCRTFHQEKHGHGEGLLRESPAEPLTNHFSFFLVVLCA